jgi:hypothetical protein
MTALYHPTPAAEAAPESGSKSLLPRKVFFITDSHPYWLMSYYQSQCRNDPQWHHKGFENEQKAARFRWATREIDAEPGDMSGRQANEHRPVA